jgi:hypothetical protein
MNSPVVITAIVAALVTWIFMYLDARLFDTPKTKFTYFKGMAFVAALAGTVVHFMGTGATAGPINVSPMAQGTALVNGLNQEMFTGMPTF